MTGGNVGELEPGDAPGERGEDVVGPPDDVAAPASSPDPSTPPVPPPPGTPTPPVEGGDGRPPPEPPPPAGSADRATWGWPPGGTPDQQVAPAPVIPAYRSTEERKRSVYRRANPWYRRLARGVTAALVLGAVGVGVYVGARAIEDWTSRDRLPAEGPDTPVINETTILVSASTPRLELDGTLILDVDSRAFEFVGTPGGPNATDRLTSPDGQTVYGQTGSSTWRVLDAGDPTVLAVRRAIEVLADDETADTVLTNRMRRGYVDLIRRTEVGTGEDALIRYDIRLDLERFAERFPLQWVDFRDHVIPDARSEAGLTVSLWVDTDNVLVRLDDQTTGWSWERLDYSADRFEPFTPPADRIDTPEVAAALTGCTIGDTGLAFDTTLASCDQAQLIGRQLVVSVGLATAGDDATTDQVLAEVCDTIQNGRDTDYDSPSYLDLARLLDETGVCPGDPSHVIVPG